MNLVHKIEYTKITRFECIYDVDSFVNDVRRTLESKMSLSWYNCNDINFIYRITLEMCVDFLNYNYRKYEDTFKDINIECRFNNALTVIDIIREVVLDVYDKFVEVDEDAHDWIDYGFELEEDQ